MEEIQLPELVQEVCIECEQCDISKNQSNSIVHSA